MSYKVKSNTASTSLVITKKINPYEPVIFLWIPMFKKRPVSVYDDLKTGFLSKFFLLIGILLLIVYVFFKGYSLLIGKNVSGLPLSIYYFSQSSYIDSILAFSIIFIGLGIITYFIHRQFIKLAEIASEIEKEMENTKGDKK